MSAVSSNRKQILTSTATGGRPIGDRSLTDRLVGDSNPIQIWAYFGFIGRYSVSTKSASRTGRETVARPV